MKTCGHEHVTVEGCDTCYIVVLKKRVARLLAAEHKRLDRIKELESDLRELRGVINRLNSERVQQLRENKQLRELLRMGGGEK